MSLLERGIVARVADGVRWIGNVTVDFPATIQDIVRARIDRLAEAVKTTLQNGRRHRPSLRAGSARAISDPLRRGGLPPRHDEAARARPRDPVVPRARAGLQARRHPGRRLPEPAGQAARGSARRHRARHRGSLRGSDRRAPGPPRSPLQPRPAARQGGAVRGARRRPRGAVTRHRRGEEPLRGRRSAPYTRSPARPRRSAPRSTPS